jgi:hypothetical protein
VSGLSLSLRRQPYSSNHEDLRSLSKVLTSLHSCLPTLAYLAKALMLSHPRHQTPAIKSGSTSRPSNFSFFILTLLGHWRSIRPGVWRNFVHCTARRSTSSGGWSSGIFYFLQLCACHIVTHFSLIHLALWLVIEEEKRICRDCSEFRVL